MSHDAASNSGNTVLAASLALDDGSLAHGLLFFDSTGRLSTFVRTNPYVPRHLAFSPNGELWVFGHPEREPGATPGYLDAFRRYRADGKLLSSHKPWNSFGATWATRFVRMGSSPALFATSDRLILVLARAGMQYFEFSHDGKLLLKTTLKQNLPGPDSEMTHLSVTSDNQVIGFFARPQGAANFRWNRDGQSWTEITGVGSPLLGFAGGRPLIGPFGRYVVRDLGHVYSGQYPEACRIDCRSNTQPD